MRALYVWILIFLCLELLRGKKKTIYSLNIEYKNAPASLTLYVYSR